MRASTGRQRSVIFVEVLLCAMCWAMSAPRAAAAAIKIPPAQVLSVTGGKCARVAKAWVPGAYKKGKFTPSTDALTKLKRDLKKAKGARKKTIQRAISKATAKYKLESSRCFKAGLSADLAPTAQHKAVHLSVTLDDTRTTTASIGADGGTVEATAADGTVYRLEIPQNALLLPAKISLTPVGEISGLPFSAASSSTGVQFAPQGLRFLLPAVLTIVPSAAIPVEQQLFIEWSGTDNVLGLAEPADNSGELKTKVYHFSGQGVARSKGLDADLTEARKLGADAETRISQAIAEMLGRERYRQLMGLSTDEDQTAVFQEIVDHELGEQFLNEVGKPRLAAASSSCAAGTVAISTLLGYGRQLQLLGGDSEPIMQQVPGLITTVAQVCMKEEYEICRDEHVITRIIPSRHRLARQIQLLGGDPSAIDALDDYVVACLRFELQFKSEAGIATSPYIQYSEKVEGTLPLAYTPPIFTLEVSGFGDLASTEYLVSVMVACVAPTDILTAGAPLYVSSLRFVVADEDVTDVQMDYNVSPNGTTFMLHKTCDPPGPDIPQPTLNWSTPFLSIMYGTSGWQPMTGWTIIGGEQFAERHLIEYVPVAEATTYARVDAILKHVPHL